MGCFELVGENSWHNAKYSYGNKIYDKYQTKFRDIRNYEIADLILSEIDTDELL